MGKAVWKKQNKSEQVSLEMSFNLFRGQDFLLNFFQMKWTIANLFLLQEKLKEARESFL